MDPSPSRRYAAKGVTPASIIAAATNLTRQRGLTGWTMRELATELGVATSALYHHVGDQASLMRAVVAGLAASFPRVDPALEWATWFEETLIGISRNLHDYPGVAHWFMMHGPTLAEALDIVDAGIAALERGGFGASAGYAYSLLFNQAVSMMVTLDERKVAAPRDGDRAMEALAADFTSIRAQSHGMDVLLDSVVRPLADTPDVHERWLRRSLRTTIRGLRAELLEAVDHGA